MLHLLEHKYKPHNVENVNWKDIKHNIEKNSKLCPYNQFMSILSIPAFRPTLQKPDSTHIPVYVHKTVAKIRGEGIFLQNLHFFMHARTVS